MKGEGREVRTTSNHWWDTFYLTPAMTHDSCCLLSTSQRILHTVDR